MKRVKKNAEKGKPYTVIAIAPGSGRSAIIRTTSTFHHAVKHACFAAELGIAAQVTKRSGKRVFKIPPIDPAHRVKPECKRDRRYYGAVQ